MWQKGGGMFCHGVEAEEEKVEGNSDLDPDYEDNYDHGDQLDPEELVVDSEDEEEGESNKDNKEEDDDRYTVSERAYHMCSYVRLVRFG